MLKRCAKCVKYKEKIRDLKYVVKVADASTKSMLKSTMSLVRTVEKKYGVKGKDRYKPDHAKIKKDAKEFLKKFKR